MLRMSFEVITLLICYNEREDILYNYGFFHMRQIEEVWNINITG